MNNEHIHILAMFPILFNLPLNKDHASEPQITLNTGSLYIHYGKVFSGRSPQLT
jgi:hypothetical protein